MEHQAALPSARCRSLARDGERLRARTSTRSSTPRRSTARRKDEPPDAGRGPAAFYATALWFREWFDDLAFEIHEVVAEGDLVVVHNTMSGRQTGTATIYGPGGVVVQAMPATRKAFATTQTHWLRVRDGKVVEHWANRDDQGTAMQLGWVPPTPWFLIKAFVATRHARRRESTPARAS